MLADSSKLLSRCLILENQRSCVQTVADNYELHPSIAARIGGAGSRLWYLGRTVLRKSQPTNEGACLLLHSWPPPGNTSETISRNLVRASLGWTDTASPGKVISRLQLAGVLTYAGVPQRSCNLEELLEYGIEGRPMLPQSRATPRKARFTEHIVSSGQTWAS